jgi:hypothetical protein
MAKIISSQGLAMQIKNKRPLLVRLIRVFRKIEQVAKPRGHLLQLLCRRNSASGNNCNTDRSSSTHRGCLTASHGKMADELAVIAVGRKVL